ncbi:hypothetical protein GGR50DRAFT_57347 [Xylaria sp. CBS 124048]|nr:hypothetical protein GGR50DRAFT_57347 [Xylaria sp. CBS 124048]
MRKRLEGETWGCWLLLIIIHDTRTLNGLTAYGSQLNDDDDDDDDDAGTRQNTCEMFLEDILVEGAHSHLPITEISGHGVLIRRRHAPIDRVLASLVTSYLVSPTDCR